ncbi:hypothetical protein Syun_016873 [Stephania yunnanensis]|uniref:Uncharacterized protein n=1 Tax=Stephania yunnanensis TaxID=152371 RepID=A0AAP0J5R2_9MAGN
MSTIPLNRETITPDEDRLHLMEFGGLQQHQQQQSPPPPDTHRNRAFGPLGLLRQFAQIRVPPIPPISVRPCRSLIDLDCWFWRSSYLQSCDCCVDFGKLGFSHAFEGFSFVFRASEDVLAHVRSLRDISRESMDLAVLQVLLTAYSSVESILDKENFSLEELLDEEEIIQECKALNSRLINFLRDRAQVEQLLHYIVEEAPEEAESKRTFKFPFIACEIFTCEIDVILKTLVEEEELMDLLFSFLEPNHPHCPLLAGYFSKVVVCLMLRKTVPLMNYVQAHQDVFRQLVDLIGITSIMEVLIRLVGADDHMYPNFVEVMQWLADSNLLEMIVDKLNPACSPEVHANAAETLCAITRNSPSALSAKISSPSFVERIFSHALENSQSKSSLVHSLAVCVSLLDPKRLASPSFYSIRSQHLYEPPSSVNYETVSAMLPKVGEYRSVPSLSLNRAREVGVLELFWEDLLMSTKSRKRGNVRDLLVLLDVSSDEKVLSTTYGQLKPPLGKHRLKIVEFIAVLLRTGNEVAEQGLVSLGAIKKILDLFFEYPFNNALHHQTESIVISCLESKNVTVVEHLLRDCDLVGKLLEADAHPTVSDDPDRPTSSAAGRNSPRAGLHGHITRISNKLLQLSNGNNQIQMYLQENAQWIEWQSSVLQPRNVVENVNRWACGRPTALQDRTRDSDDDDIHDRDYDVAALANNLSQAFRYSLYENDDAEQVHGSLERDDETEKAANFIGKGKEGIYVVLGSIWCSFVLDSDFLWKDVYFDDESAEVVISSLRLGDDQESLFTNSNWFAFQEDRVHNEPMSTSPSEKLDDINLNDNISGGSSSSDDEVVVGEDEELVNNAATSVNGASNSGTSSGDGASTDVVMENASSPDRSSPEWVAWQEPSDLPAGGSDGSTLHDDVTPDADSSDLAETTVAPAPGSPTKVEVQLPNGTTSPVKANGGQLVAVQSLFEDDVEFVGVELEGTEKAMEQALKEGIVGEAGPLKRNHAPKVVEKVKTDDDEEKLEFNDANYWRMDQEVAVVQE